MNRFIAILFLALAATAANAQDIFNELRRDQSGQGKIVVNQSKEIEQLVNAKTQSTAASQTATAKPQTVTPKTQAVTPKTQAAQSDGKTVTPKPATPTHTTTQQTPQDKVAVKPADSIHSEHVAGTMHYGDTLASDTVAETPKKRIVRKNMDTVEADGTSDGTVNLNRKVMRHAYKTTGYRVQVYSGGNTRADRQKCHEIAAKIKASYPNMPIYVHFYSPSWKCRAGNFTDKGEAEKFLRKVKGMGYKTAVLVKGTISVQY